MYGRTKAFILLAAPFGVNRKVPFAGLAATRQGMSRHMSSPTYDAVVVGAGPNGLAAAITLRRAGCSVLVLEGGATTGGGLRSRELTLPGFVHDVCAAVHPLGRASPFFRSLPLAQHGVTWVEPDAELAHPLDNGRAVMLERSLQLTGAGMGAEGAVYASRMDWLVRHWEPLMGMLLGPLRWPRRPLLLARFGLAGMRSARTLAQRYFSAEEPRALFAGLAAHAVLPLEQRPTAAFGLILALLGHAVGWPLVRGGSQRLADAMTSYLESLGGEIRTNAPVACVDELPESRVVLLDVAPKQLLRLAGHRLTTAYRRQLERYRYGPGVFKMDWALDAPIPWRAGECRRAATVHLGGTLPEIAAAERSAFNGRRSERPFVILAQPSLFDDTRAPAGRHTAWAYCHVPHGSTLDMSDAIERQIERFAPGFRERVLARHVMAPAALEQYNPNYVGGDISGGVQDLGQLFTRPARRLRPYATTDRRLYICSASTPPGGGVHGMGGYFAAQLALRQGLRHRTGRVCQHVES